MQVKLKRSFYPLCISNNTIRETRRYTIKVVFCVMLLSCFIIGYSYAGTWRDLFDQAKLHDWERLAEVNRWETEWNIKGGRLIARINKPQQIHTIASDILRWKAREFNLNRVTVVGEEIPYNRFLQDGNGELCLFVGKWNAASEFADGYLFSPVRTEKMGFTAKGIYKFGRTKGHYSDRLPLTSKHLKVVFENSRFRLFTEDILLLDFIDDEIIFVDLVGLILFYKPFGNLSTASISTFSISGRDIPNHNFLDIRLRRDQLTTIWAELKWQDE